MSSPPIHVHFHTPDFTTFSCFHLLHFFPYTWLVHPLTLSSNALLLSSRTATSHSPNHTTSKLKNMFFRTRILCPVVKWQHLHLKSKGGGQRQKEVCRSTDNEGNLVGICAACRSVSSTEQLAQRRVRIRLSTCVLTTRTHYHLASTSSILFS